MPDNLRHAKYGADGIQIDDPQKVWEMFTSGNLKNACLAYPFDDDGIDAAIEVVNNSGGTGTVIFAPTVYRIRRGRELKSGVSYYGVPMELKFGALDNVPDFWTPSDTGTRFNLDPGITMFTWNSVDQGSVQSPLMAFALTSVEFYGLAFIGGDCGIKIGAKNAMGCVKGRIDLCVFYNQTSLGADIQNSQFFDQDRIFVKNDVAEAVGTNWRYANTLPEGTLLTGDSQIGEIFSRVTSPTRRGVLFEAGGGVTPSILNDVVVHKRIHSSRYGSSAPTTVNITATSGDPNFSVPNSAQFQLCQIGMNIRFQSTAPSPFSADPTYFVVARNTSNNTIQLAETDYSAAITPTASATYAMYVAGYPTFIARADSGCAVKNSDFGALACEVTGNIGSVMFSGTRNCFAKLTNPSTSFTNTSVIRRNAEIGISYAGANNVTEDKSGQSGGLGNFVNLAGGAYQHTSGNITLDSSWHQRNVRYSGTGNITVTIVDKQVGGFDIEFFTTNTGSITFVAGAGTTIFSKSASKATNGQYSIVRLINVSPGVYALVGEGLAP